MIAFLLSSLLALALIHFAYERALAPSLRLGARYRLFASRDELRKVATRIPEGMNHKAVRILEDAINNQINWMSEFGPVSFYRMDQRLRADPNFKSRIENRLEAINSIGDEDFQAVLKEINEVMKSVLLINMGAWFTYIFPVALCAVLADRFVKSAKLLVALPCDQAKEMLPSPFRSDAVPA